MKKSFFVSIIFLFSLMTHAQEASFLRVGTGLQNEVQTPFGGNEGPSVKAELKMASALNLPGDYARTINLALYPWWDAGMGHAYNINVNWDGIYYRRNNNQNGSQWDGWRKLIMAWTDGSVHIDGLLTARAGMKIGSATSSQNLDVYGTIRAKELRVETMGADFVFDDNYKLKSLEEVKAHIDENKHLPGIPSAAEMQQNGVGISELSTKLLQKVEELTLYAIQQQERIEKLEKQNETLLHIINQK